jgi:hypothetical protein
VLRRIFRPLFLLGIFYGPIIALFGGVMDWVYQEPGLRVWGLPKAELLWLLGLGCLLFAGVVKMLVFRLSARREGYSLGSFLRRVYTLDYLRVVASVTLLAIILSVLVAHLGQAGMIAGVVTMCFGLLWVLMPLALPLPESSFLGWFFLLGGGLAPFIFPERPFLVLALIWGIGCSALMPLAYFQRAAAAGDGKAGCGSEKTAHEGEEQS